MSSPTTPPSSCAFLEAAGVELGEVHCTLQAARLTIGGYGPSLADAAKAHLGRRARQVRATARIGRRPSSVAPSSSTPPCDAVMVFRLAQRILPALGCQASAYEIQIGVTPAVVRLRHRGVRLDLDAHAELMQSLRGPAPRGGRRLSRRLPRHGPA